MQVLKYNQSTSSTTQTFPRSPFKKQNCTMLHASREHIATASRRIQYAGTTFVRLMVQITTWADTLSEMLICLSVSLTGAPMHSALWNLLQPAPPLLSDQPETWCIVGVEGFTAWSEVNTMLFVHARSFSRRWMNHWRGRSSRFNCSTLREDEFLCILNYSYGCRRVFQLVYTQDQL